MARFSSEIPSSCGDCSWEDVLESIEVTRNEYDIKVKKSKTSSISKNRALLISLEMLADMIPDQDGLSVLRGGLKFVFKLIQRRIDNQGTILRTFEDIPTTFSRACEALKIHPDDTVLRGNVEGLFNVLITEIPKLSDILLRRHKGSFPTRMLKQHPEQESTAISNCLELVSRESNKVSTRVDILNDKIAVDTLSEARAVRMNVAETQAGVQEIHQTLRSISASRRTFNEGYIMEAREHSSKLETLAGTIDSKIESVTVSLRAELQYLRYLLLTAMEQSSISRSSLTYEQDRMTRHAFLSSAGSAKDPLTDIPMSSSIPPGRRTVSLSCLDILEIIQATDASFIADDVEYSIHASNQLEGLDRGGWLLVTDRFRSWAQLPRSDIILVDGYLGDISTGRISPLSGICALFAGLRMFPKLVVLHHFCGLHSNAGETLSGPRGLMLSIITQFIIQFDKHFHGTPVYWELGQCLLSDARHNDIPSLCLLFQQLVSQVPRDFTIYCLMDSIPEFETSSGGWDDELSQIVGFLRGILLEERPGPCLKILMTSAHKSISICRLISPEDQISLGAQNTLSATTQLPAFEDRLRAVMFSDGFL